MKEGNNATTGIFVDNLNNDVLQSPFQRYALLISAVNEKERLLEYARQFKQQQDTLLA